MKSNDMTVIEALALAQKRFPSQRTSQIICNAIFKVDPYYITDQELVQAILQYVAYANKKMKCQHKFEPNFCHKCGEQKNFIATNGEHHATD